MACHKPLQAFRGREKTKTGKNKTVFRKDLALVDGTVPGIEFQLPCRQCIGCRIDRSAEWAIRCMHEAKYHEDNCFITLTYSDQFLPSDCGLHYDHFQLFMKRLRKKFGSGIRFYMCGEYGSLHGRPHFHAAIFGHDFKDKYDGVKRGDFMLYRSYELEKLWTYGYSSVGTLTFNSAAYIARYITKKIYGELANEHYKRFVVDEETGEITDEFSVRSEFTNMSRKPGLAYRWFEDNKDSDLKKDFITLGDGKKYKIPKYYDKLLELGDEVKFAKRKVLRKVKGMKHKVNNTPERLAVREEVLNRKLTMLKREL